MRAVLTHVSAAWGAMLLFSLILAADGGKLVRVAQTSYSSRDLTGVWMPRNSTSFSAKEPPMQPWAQEKFNAVKPSWGPRATVDSGDPTLKCLPPGVPRIMLEPFPIQIAQISGQVLMMFEYDHFLRQIYLDRQTHPDDLDPSWMGDSIGRWDGDTLVVDTVGLNDRSWLDQVGHPHSNALHVTERIRRNSRDTLVDDITIDDPKAYTRTWTGQQVFELRPGWHLMEYVCEDMMPESPK